MKPRLVFAVTFPLLCWLMVGPYLAVFAAMFVSLPVLWLGKGLDRVGSTAGAGCR